jgi:hypothetical protein
VLRNGRATAPPPRSRSSTGAAARLTTLFLLLACAGSDAGETDMRVDGEAAMDTTPAGTPAPPSIPAITQDARRQTTVTLHEWGVAIEAEALPAGEFTFQAANAGAEPHALAVEGAGLTDRTDPIPPGGAASLAVRLAPGTYRLFCPDSTGGASHASRGMSVPLVVR